jgi:hypothetical protein
MVDFSLIKPKALTANGLALESPALKRMAGKPVL